MKVLVYTRPRIKEFFHHLADHIESFSDITYMSDHKGEEPLWIMKYYYQAIDDLAKTNIEPKTDIDDEGVALRCRYLRTLTSSEAKHKVKAMTIAVERIVDEYKPDMVFGMVMDSYILDIFDLVLRKQNMQYVGFLNNMLNGYSRLTSRGELIKLNDAPEESVKSALEDLSRKNYVPNMQNDFMWKTTPFSMFFTKFLKEKLKITYYAIKKRIDNDMDNFYYNTVASKECMSCRKVEQLFYRKYQSSDWLEKVKQAKSAGKTIVYMPLQFYPECSLDYWSNNIKFANFYAVVEKVLNNEYKDIIILAKEHPSATGLRKVEFYQQFNQNENVLLTPFDTPSNNVIAQSDVVVTWSGSVGVEAIMRNKKLISLGETYYDPGYGIRQLTQFEQLGELESIIKDVLGAQSHDIEKHKFDVVEHMIKGLIPGYVFPLDYGSKKNPIAEDRMTVLATGINKLVIQLTQDGAYPVKDGCI